MATRGTTGKTAGKGGMEKIPAKGRKAGAARGKAAKPVPKRKTPAKTVSSRKTPAKPAAAKRPAEAAPEDAAAKREHYRMLDEALGQARVLRDKAGNPLAFACWANVNDEVVAPEAAVPEGGLGAE